MTATDRKDAIGHDGPFAGVIFDLDGVLTDTEHLWEENWTAYSTRYGKTWAPHDTAAVMGMSVPEWSRYLADHAGNGQPAQTVADAVIDGMIAALEKGRVELAPGAVDLVTTVAGRAPLALASSAPRRLILAVLSATDLLRYFTATVSSEEVPRGKPSPDVYREAAHRLGLDPHGCLGVEDSTNGIKAAVAAGLTVIAIPNHQYPPNPDALALCTMVVSSLAEVRTGIMQRLDSRDV